MKINPSMYNIQNQTHLGRTHVDKNKLSKRTESFNQVLNEQFTKKEVSFSKHATTRLHARNINLSKDQLNRINHGVNEALDKGIKESLVLIDDVALVVNVKNKVVVTAMDKSEQQSKVFTNIDGAVVL